MSIEVWGGSSSSVRSQLVEASEDLTAKRLTGGFGLDKWYPYYAGFSFPFASEVLRSLTSRPCVVLDPWNGSGTTTAAAQHLGHRPIGFDLNPATVVIARAKLVTRQEVARLTLELEQTISRALGQARVPVSADDPLLPWLSPAAVAFARAALLEIMTRCEPTAPDRLDPLSALAATCLLRALRSHAVDSARSNSSWQLPAPGKRPIPKTLARDSLEAAAEIAKEWRELPMTRAKQLRLRVGDARRLPLRDRSVDVVLSSPPYCTRIDYAKQTNFELAALFSFKGTQFRGLRDSLMGTTTIRRSGSNPRLAESVEALLDRIGAHPSHRSAGYYAANFRQYFADASLAVGEIARVLRAGGRAVLVLQNSYYKEIAIPLSTLYCDIASGAGLKASIIAQKPVGRSMCSVNTKAKQYRRERRYSEDIILLEK